LGGDHGTFVQFYERHCVWSIIILAAGSFINGCIRVHFTLAAEGIEFFGFIATVWAYVARRENLIIAMRADLAY